MIAEYNEHYPITMQNRTYLPYLFKTNCQKCGKELSAEYKNDNYLSNPSLSNPKLGCIVHIYFCCDDCEHDQFEDALFELKITPVQ